MPKRGVHSKSPHGTNARRQWCTDGPNGRPCDPCRAAHALEMKLGNESRRARLAADYNVVAHGLSSTYDNWGCRCDPCMTEKRRTWKARQAARPLKSPRMAALKRIKPFGREWLNA